MTPRSLWPRINRPNPWPAATSWSGSAKSRKPVAARGFDCFAPCLVQWVAGGRDGSSSITRQREGMPGMSMRRQNVDAAISTESTSAVEALEQLLAGRLSLHEHLVRHAPSHAIAQHVKRAVAHQAAPVHAPETARQRRNFVGCGAR